MTFTMHRIRKGQTTKGWVLAPHTIKVASSIKGVAASGGTGTDHSLTYCKPRNEHV